MAKIPAAAPRLNGNGKNGKSAWAIAIIAGWIITALITWSVATNNAVSLAQEQIMQNKQDIAVNQQSLATICEDIKEVKADVKILLRRD